MRHVALAAASGDSMAWLTGINLVPVGATSVLVIVALMVYTGRLIPRSTHRSICESKDSQIETWQAAHSRSEAARELQAQAMAEMVEQGRSTVSALQGLNQAARSQQEGPTS